MRPAALAGEPAPLPAMSGDDRIVHALRRIPSDLPTPLTVPGEFRLVPRDERREPFASQQSDFASVMALQVDGLELTSLMSGGEQWTSDRAQVNLCVWVDRRTIGVDGGASRNTGPIHESDMKIILDRVRRGSDSADMTVADRDLDAAARFVRLNLERMNATSGFSKGSVVSFIA